jgi:hypothetical protein
MDLEHSLAPGPVMQPVNVLGDQRQPGLLFLELSQSVVPQVRPASGNSLPPPVVPGPNEGRIPMKRLGRSQFLSPKVPPKPLRGPKGRNPAFRGDPSPGKHRNPRGRAQPLPSHRQLRSLDQLPLSPDGTGPRRNADFESKCPGMARGRHAPLPRLPSATAICTLRSKARNPGKDAKLSLCLRLTPRCVVTSSKAAVYTSFVTRHEYAHAQRTIRPLSSTPASDGAGAAV